MRRRLISCIDALLVGMILGLLFVTFVHASPAYQAGQGHPNQWTVVCDHIRQLRVQ